MRVAQISQGATKGSSDQPLPWRQSIIAPSKTRIDVHRITYLLQHKHKVTKDGARFAMVGHSTKVLTPPYGDTTQAKRQQERRQRLKTMLLSAGWSSQSELDTAYLKGVVVIPHKQMSATTFDTAIALMAVEE